MRNIFRSRQVVRPSEISRMGWLDILWRVKREMADDNITMLAAGAAFYAFLAVFPAIAAVISLWALVLDPLDMARQISELSRFIPPGAAYIIEQQANEISSNTRAGLSVTAIASLLVAMYIASKGIRGVIVGLNVVYGEQERRGFLSRALTVSLLTLGMIVLTLVTIPFITLFPLAIGMLGIDSTPLRVIGLLRWPILVLVMMFAIAVLYRYGPYRASPHWEWISVGTVTATFLWLLGSLGLSLYVRYFSNLSEIYGSLGAVVVLLLWFWLSAFMVLLGAELNTAMERHARRDATFDTLRPVQRHAHVADAMDERRS
ncbi:hypothetical protein GCM10007160_22880 [Litchfieldella qijiaojingensis]|uniref:YihY/virulence factor BrkB family protein n=1 Tax=Litchfieldella qijiaojingensis TaxID=980347 RepID=A0ABQ2YWN7_9GAMM|nr:YihY/virulence factor BrkB family protein [Halomonas qijiaojingensis]GGX94656.1 hypothetical protein GCM10007160_22880 [Halomonas qijiaojingensis]